MTSNIFKCAIFNNTPKGDYKNAKIYSSHLVVYLQKAMEIVNLIETPFKSANGVLPQQLLPSREVKIDDGKLIWVLIFLIVLQKRKY